MMHGPRSLWSTMRRWAVIGVIGLSLIAIALVGLLLLLPLLVAGIIALRFHQRRPPTKWARTRRAVIEAEYRVVSGEKPEV